MAPPSEALGRARELDEQIKALHRRRNAQLAQLVARVSELKGLEGFLDLGFDSIHTYTRDRLGWSRDKTNRLLLLEDRLKVFPQLREAFRDGQLDWTKAELASRATEKDPGAEQKWLEDALRLPSRDLERKAAEALGEEQRIRWTLELTLEQEALLQEGLRALRSEGKNPSREEGLLELVRRALQGGGSGSSTFRVLLGLCPGCEQGVQHARGGDLKLPREEVERILCDAEVQDTSQEPARVSRTAPPRVKESGESVVLRKKKIKRRDSPDCVSGPGSQARPNKIQARSKGCCEVPSCTNRAYLEFHHDDGWRAGHDVDRMFHLCDSHHQARHEGKLRIEGSWATGVCFRLADGTLLGTAGGQNLVLAESQSVVEPAASPAPVASEAPSSSGSVRDNRSVDLASVGDAQAERAAPDHRSSPSEARPADTAEAVAFALKALRTLELKQKEARQWIEVVLERDPGPWTAEGLIRAVLLALPVRRKVLSVA